MGLLCAERCDPGWGGFNCSQHNCNGVGDGTCNSARSAGHCSGPSECSCEQSFTGSTCSECIDGRFGEDCLLLPATRRLVPASGPDIGGTLITIFGFNLDPTLTYQCRVGASGDFINANHVGDERVGCIIPPADPARLVDSRHIDLHLYVASELVQHGNALSFYYTPSCLDAFCGHGVCLAGGCFCQHRWSGPNCTEEIFDVSAADIDIVTFMEGANDAARLAVSAGSGPILWQFAPEQRVPEGLALSSDGVLTWVSPKCGAICSAGVTTVQVTARNRVSSTGIAVRLMLQPAWSALIESVTSRGNVFNASDTAESAVRVPSGDTIVFSGRITAVPGASVPGEIVAIKLQFELTAPSEIPTAVNETLES